MLWTGLNMDMLDHDKNLCHLEEMKIFSPKGWIRGGDKIGPVLEAKATYHLYQYGVEIKIDSMKKHGSQSCNDW